MNSISEKMMDVMEKMLPTCKTVTKQVSDSIEQKLPVFDRIKVNLHLMACESCELYRKQLLILQSLFTKYIEKMEADEYIGKITLSKEAHDRIKKLLNDQNQG